MTVYQLSSDLVFPPPEDSEPSGLLAVGGDLSNERILLAYASGIFPWPTEGQPIYWHSPDPRMVLRPADLHVSHSLAKTLRRGVFEVRVDTRFEEVIRACAEMERPGQDGTWITRDMQDAYTRLHGEGFAHSAEVFAEGELVGGLYGLSLGSAFFGESMFSHRTDASKVAFVALARQLERWQFDMLDCQLHTEHLARLGAEPWPRARYLRALDHCLEKPTRRGAWRLDPPHELEEPR